MGAFRRFLRDHRRFALACALLALALRLLIPTGMMLAPSGHAITVTLCADATGLTAKQIVLPGKPVPEKAHPEGTTCPYAALSMAALGGADAIQIAAALALLIVLGLAAIHPPRAGPFRRLRPPLRAPPVSA